MEIGNKIYELRKNAKLSQEQLAEKVNVTRQTISNWELGQTIPDISQAKEISKIFSISIDELADNDIKDILVEKISKTEKMANTTIKTIKFFCSIIICVLIFIIILVNSILFINKIEYIKYEEQKQIKEQEYKKYRKSLITRKFNCSMNQQIYEYLIQYDTDNIPVQFTLNAISLNPDATIFYNLYNDLEKEYNNHTNALELIKKVEQYFKDNNGIWEEKI